MCAGDRHHRIFFGVASIKMRAQYHTASRATDQGLPAEKASK